MTTAAMGDYRNIQVAPEGESVVLDALADAVCQTGGHIPPRDRSLMACDFHRRMAAGYLRVIVAAGSGGAAMTAGLMAANPVAVAGWLEVDRVTAENRDLRRRIDRTLDYTDSLLRLPALNAELARVLRALHESLCTPAIGDARAQR